MKRWLAIWVILGSSLAGYGQPLGIFTDQASVGDDAGAGLATFQNGVYELEGSGNDIWDVPDGFFWIFKEITGDFTATATVEWLTGVDTGDEWKKAGIIARNTVDDPERTDGEYACAAIIRNNLSNFFVRPTATEGEEDTFWNSGENISILTNTIQLKRAGDTFTMLRGLAAGGFMVLASKEIDMADTILVGLCITSHNTNTIEAARFSNVSIEQNATSVRDFVLYE
ncbi:MAG TPA: hypothetical protein PK878_20015 [bacterium]|nr:hypothetical protein [Candidatus Omnitrophota bacterium]HOJ62571.1 hypothetical protein [bacterium]HOL92859.1 hypothetical protein [bacterium]HPP01233.1 hypothetical protein [bacterium]HXK92768.1 hypothetical protein [bacterium]